MVLSANFIVQTIRSWWYMHLSLNVSGCGKFNWDIFHRAHIMNTDVNSKTLNKKYEKKKKKKKKKPDESISAIITNNLQDPCQVSQLTIDHQLCYLQKMTKCITMNIPWSLRGIGPSYSLPRMFHNRTLRVKNYCLLQEDYRCNENWR